MQYLDADGNALPAPKTRTFATIRKTCMTETARRNAAPRSTRKDQLARRAFQYANALVGRETLHSACPPRSLGRLCVFDRAPDGSNRVFQVLTDTGTVTIPHWDFTPEAQTDISGR